MSKTKIRPDIEIYEDYWNFTAAWTDIFGVKFNNCLNVIVNYIDINFDEIEKNSQKNGNFKESSLYKDLQVKIVNMMKFVGKDASLSARKAINMFVKIGYINPYLLGYHSLVKKFLLENDKEKKKIIFSKIFYESASLASDVTLDNRHLKHISFFLQTLDKNRNLSMEDFQALMVTDIQQYKKGYLTREELNSQYDYASANEFKERKYNQISHLCAYLQNFVDLKYDKTEGFWFADDPDIVNKEFNNSYKRDPIKYRIYRDELRDLSIKLYKEKLCFVEKKPYKGLVASHIKPVHVCLKMHEDDEAYDVNNGLLLSQNVDQYFNDFDITFNSCGEIIFGKNVHSIIRQEYINYKLDPEIMTDERKKYLKYHQEEFSRKE